MLFESYEMVDCFDELELVFTNVVLNVDIGPYPKGTFLEFATLNLVDFTVTVEKYTYKIEVIVKSSTFRGHPIYTENGKRFYCDTGESVDETWHTRNCGYCGEFGNSSNGDPDPCLGQLPGVTQACCGHGDREHSYLCLKGGPVLRGFYLDTN